MQKSILTFVSSFLIGVTAIHASVQTDIEKANKEGKVVLLVVTEHGNEDNISAIHLANEAHKLNAKSSVIEMNRNSKVNENLVAKYRLASVQLPLIMVIASNGVVAGSANFKQTTTEKLVELIPSPKKAEVLKFVNDGKSIFIVVSKKAMQKKEVLKSCNVACHDMKKNAGVVEIDFDDKEEKKFLNELKITKIGNSPQTIVINSQGQIAGSYTGVTDSKTLVASASKKSSSGCCAPGSGKSCGTTKK
jgi:hypothetical protein